MESPINSHSIFWNSSYRFAKATNSVVHTGVKSAGWLNNTNQCLLKSFGNFFLPWVVITSISGNLSPINGNELKFLDLLI